MTTRSARHRAGRRHPRRWWQEPIISPYADRLFRKMMGSHRCQHIEVYPTGFLIGAAPDDRRR